MILYHGLEECDRVETEMPEKLLVFILQHTSYVFVGIVVAGWEPPLRVIGDMGSQQ